MTTQYSTTKYFYSYNGQIKIIGIKIIIIIISPHKSSRIRRESSHTAHTAVLRGKNSPIILISLQRPAAVVIKISIAKSRWKYLITYYIQLVHDQGEIVSSSG